MITSRSNRVVKIARALRTRKGRDEHGLVLLEGRRLIEAVVVAGGTLETVVTSEEAPWVENLPSSIVRARETVVQACCDTSTPQGTIAFARKPERRPTTVDLALVVDAVSDPGNLGALLRTAAAAEFDAAILVGSQTADPFGPKCLRAAMGATFIVPILQCPSWTAAKKHLDDWNLTAIAADSNDTSRPYTAVDLTWDKTALVVGAEVGLSPDIPPHLDRVHIPIADTVDSLNVAIAGSVLMLEAAARRRREEESSS